MKKIAVIGAGVIGINSILQLIEERTKADTENDYKIVWIYDTSVDIFGIGADWTGKFDDLGDICEVVYLGRTEGISTTELRQSVQELLGDSFSGAGFPERLVAGDGGGAG